MLPCLKVVHQVAFPGKLGGGFSFHFRRRKTSSEGKLLADLLSGRDWQEAALDLLSACNRSLFVFLKNYGSLEIWIHESS